MRNTGFFGNFCTVNHIVVIHMSEGSLKIKLQKETLTELFGKTSEFLDDSDRLPENWTVS